MTSTEFALWVLLASVAVLAGFGLRAWYVAERDERAWRRRFEAEKQAALIRQARYGTKGGTRHDH